MSIKQLPDEVVDRLEASVAITSINGVVLDLLKNSLDASSTNIRISLDYARGNCYVEDNGDGILPAEFTEKGGLGKLHYTSKFPLAPNIHGKRGDFLAALGGLSLLCITSRHREHRSHNSITIHNRRVLSRNCPEPLEKRLTTFGHGTRVLVRNLFGSMPVRVKQRGLTSGDRSRGERDWSQLSRGVVSLLLSWDADAVVTIRDDNGERELQLHTGHALSMPSKVARLLVQSSLAVVEDAGSWKVVSGSSQNISVSGCISLHPAPSRRSQFISIGIQPLEDHYGSNVFFAEVNKIFKHSDFGMEGGAETASRDVKLRKSLDHWPMFYLRVQADDGLRAVAETGDRWIQRLEPILNLLHAVCYGFLRNYGFRPRKSAKVGQRSKLAGTLEDSRPSASTSRSSRSATPSSAPLTRVQSPFDTWSRVKVGVAPPPKQATEEQVRKKNRLVGEDGMILSRPFQEPPVAVEQTRTFAPEPSSEMGTEMQGVESRKRPRILDLKRPKSEKSAWLEVVAKSWQNPIFEMTERSVPLAYDATACERSHHWSSTDASFGRPWMELEWKLSKDGLRHAEVISQVDRKFILVKLLLNHNEQTASMLAMLDQHAVDERCQLEALMREFFIEQSPGVFRGKIDLLDTALSFEISSREAQILAQHRNHFLYWGIVYAVSAGGCTVRVTGLPSSILERCKTEPKLMLNILRQEAWKLCESGSPPEPGSLSSTAEHGWISRFHGCPSGLLDLLHSRSCRNAIMFNDSLTKEDCVSMIKRLSDCAFPFQCAHGRPSMAPLLDIGHFSQAASAVGEETKGEKEAMWKTYMDWAD